MKNTLPNARQLPLAPWLDVFTFVVVQDMSEQEKETARAIGEKIRVEREIDEAVKIIEPILEEMASTGLLVKIQEKDEKEPETIEQITARIKAYTPPKRGKTQEERAAEILKRFNK